MLAKQGIFPGGDNIIDLCQPSTDDYQENESTAMSDLEENEEEIQDIKSRAIEGLAGGAELRSLPYKEIALTGEKALLSTSGAFNTYLGCAFAGSGFRRKQQEPAERGCCLDWALVKVN